MAEKSLPGSRVFPCRPRAPPRAGAFGRGERGAKAPGRQANGSARWGGLRRSRG
ncbi:hypothetical protein CSB92_3406 [Pseudomonas aeruginosa]|nr:Hypothetical protein SCV20265_0960 [Pseudomonas aeruginosa SCV20265]AWF62257.1 hypothetical protein CSC30_4525 [Pseudomonas aeruginosa]SMZ48830.1 hypothetical protein PANN_10020 [Pseudomonas aeruginosa C-NN2]AWF66290.1 hypothetical protein CSC27_0136 [Pseudomonas aeruginosa]AXA06496.1 hypothetical protein CSC44_1959 [Pseudomonas aeruginosa]